MQLTPKLRLLREAPGTALLDGDNGMGPVVATAAMRLALEKARMTGTGVVAVRRGNHYGMAATYPLMALAEDCIGLTVTNGPALVAPWAGAPRGSGHGDHRRRPREDHQGGKGKATDPGGVGAGSGGAPHHGLGGGPGRGPPPPGGGPR